MAPLGGFTAICLVVSALYFVGFFTFLMDAEKNRCDMTFMFEYPQFVKIGIDAGDKYKQYGLYAYSEGVLTERARSMHFDGIPILFIPGSSGSFQQVRSMASVALRKSFDDRPGFHFDYFTLNFNQELSAFNGVLLSEQTEFAKLAVKKILKLISKGSKRFPESVILIGHSMGGIIAQYLRASLGPNCIPLIITLATPHSRPPIIFDPYIVNYYRQLKLTENSTSVAISGGYNDMLIAPFLTAGFSEDLHVVTTAVPTLWLSVDHRCILWCKQLVLALNRALFDSVDLNTKQLSTDHERLRNIFNYHLVHNSGTAIGKLWVNGRQLLPETKFKSDGDWIENLRSSYSVIVNKTTNAQWHMIRLVDISEFEYVTVLAVNLKVENWIFACAADRIKNQRRFCLNGLHLSQFSEIAPSLDRKRRIVTLNLAHLKGNYSEMTHVVVRILPTNELVELHVDRFAKLNRRTNVVLPNWWSFDKRAIISETKERTLYYEFRLPQLQSTIQSYYMYVRPVECSNKKHHAAAYLSVPWNNQKSYAFFTESEKAPFHLRLYNSRPSKLSHLSDPPSVSIVLTLDPVCTYSISFADSPINVVAQVVRIHSPLMTAHVAAVILLTFRTQLGELGSFDSCSLFFTAINSGIKPYYILTLVKISSRILNSPTILTLLPKPDWKIIAEEGNDFLILPLVLYMSSVGLVWLVSVVLIVSLILYESTFFKMASKLVEKTGLGVSRISDWLIGCLEKLPYVASAILVSLSFTSCGALALALGCAFYFLKLTHMSQDYIEDATFRFVKRCAYFIKRMFSRLTNRTCAVQEELTQALFDATCHSAISFHFTLFLLWCMATALSIPSLLTWAHNFKYNEISEPDFSQITGVVFSLCAGPLWQMKVPKTRLCAGNLRMGFYFLIMYFLNTPLGINTDILTRQSKVNLSRFRKWYKELSYLMAVLALINLVYATLFLYRSVYILSVAVLAVTLHQIVAPIEQGGIDVGIREPDATQEITNTIKAKTD